MQIKAIAFDPGGTTGFCLSQLVGEKIYIAYTQQVLKEAKFFDLLIKLQPQHVVCESFEYRQSVETTRGADMFAGVRLIGVLNLFQQMYPQSTQVYYQNAAKGKGFWNNKNMRSAGLYRTEVDHGRDAARHMLQWWMFEQGCKYWINDMKKPEFKLTTIDYLMARFNS